MSNHYHLVVRLNPSEAETWTDEGVLERWTSLFRGPLLVQRHRTGETLSDAEQETLRAITTVYRARLADLSWFMKCLNEPIARQANAEDKCTGHFWEARFHSQALLSEQALFAAMVYVDLNPIRAGVADTPESSAFTSVRQRLRPKAEATELAASVPALFERGELRHFKLPIRPLLSFDKQAEMSVRANRADKAVRLPMHEIEYLKLVDATGRVVARGKRGLIDPDLAPVLERLGLSNEQWVDVSTGFRQHYRRGRLILKPAV